MCARTCAHVCVGYTFTVCIWRAEDNNAVISFAREFKTELRPSGVGDKHFYPHRTLVLGSQGLGLWLWHSACLAYTRHRPWVWPLAQPPPPQTQNLFSSMLGYLGEGLGFRNNSTNKSQAWWQKPFILALGRLRQGNLFIFVSLRSAWSAQCIPGQQGLCREEGGWGGSSRRKCYEWGATCTDKADGSGLRFTYIYIYITL